MIDVLPLSELRRALVIKLRHHGDVLLTSPVISVLKAHAPQCEIDALIYADTAPMLEGHPDLAQLHLIDRKWKRQGLLAQARAEWALFQALRGRQYDLIIHLTEHRRGAWLTRLLKPRWSVAPRLRRRGEFWGKSFTHLINYPTNTSLRHTVEKNLDALRRVGIHPLPEERGLTLVPGSAAEQRVEGLTIGHDLGSGFIHIHPGSRWLFKCWPPERMASLIDQLASTGYPLVLTGAPEANEMAMMAQIKSRIHAPVVDLSGQLSLKELAALTRRAKLFIGVDSAPMHIAAAMGTPVVVLFGPSGDKEWGPWMTRHRVVTTNHTCRPCGRDGCGGSKVSDCLTTLPVERVVVACHELLMG
ncbi:MAG: putative lipopolysaccharide heptosyltransferase III [Rhodocyclaceae bacterium]|nr:MAG: putative lipopolysaccharide heptosyltransferase III [Rhodocyclaceae bacterium]